MSLSAEIIYENDHVIVINKPAGLPVQTARATSEDVCSQLKNHLKGGYLGVIHRLDQPVEGLLVFAKDKETAAMLSRDLQSGKLKKSYRAVAFGKAESGGSDVCYMRKTQGGISVIGEGSGFQRAELTYELLGNDEFTSHFRIMIQTGRFHQIRAQMAHLGFPLLGDMKYGTEESNLFSGERNITFPALCADRLEFRDPGTGAERTFVTEPANPAFKIYDKGTD